MRSGWNREKRASNIKVFSKSILPFTLIFFFGSLLFSCGNKKVENESPEGEKAKIIKSYFAGWEKKDWNLVASQLAEGFTFTSPANDDHISTEKFREKCWIQAGHIQKFEFPRIIEGSNDAFVIVHVITMENKVIRNIEYFTFSNGKVKALEVFFGGTGAGFPTNAK